MNALGDIDNAGKCRISISHATMRYMERTRLNAAAWINGRIDRDEHLSRQEKDTVILMQSVQDSIDYYGVSPYGPLHEAE